MEILVGCILLYIGYCVAVYVVGTFGPPLVGYMFQFLWLCLREAVLLVLRILWWLLRSGAQLARRGTLGTWRAVRAAALFLYILASEMRRGAAAQADADADNTTTEDATDDRASESEPPPADLIEAAMTLLGLAAGFTREDLSKAYKHAIRRAHPDAGGSVDQAQAVNCARDLVRERMGWA